MGFEMDIICVRLIILKFYTMQDYVVDDVVLIWPLVDDVAVDDVDAMHLHVKRITCSES
jgi:hypothetical protein